MDEKKLREELTKKLIDLGHVTHQLERSGEVHNEDISQLSKQICLLEKNIHEASGKYTPSKEEKKCPSCLTSYEDNTVFCGKCGQNIKEFYESAMENCEVCNSIISKDSKYCGVCGSKIAK